MSALPCGTPGATRKRHSFADGDVCSVCDTARSLPKRTRSIPGVPSWARVRQAATVGAILTAHEIAGIVARIDAGDPATPALLRELRRGGIERRTTETSDTGPGCNVGSLALREKPDGGTVPQQPGSVPITPVTEAASQSLTVGGPNEGGMKLPATVTPASVVGGEGTPIVTFDPPSEPQQGASAPPCPAAALPPTGPAASLVPPAAGPVPPPRCWQCGGAGRVAGDTFESLECDCAWNNSGNCVPVCRCVNAGSATTCPRCAEVGPGPRAAETREDVPARVVLRRFLEDVRRAADAALNLIGTEG